MVQRVKVARFYNDRTPRVWKQLTRLNERINAKRRAGESIDALSAQWHVLARKDNARISQSLRHVVRLLGKEFMGEVTWKHHWGCCSAEAQSFSIFVTVNPENAELLASWKGKQKIAFYDDLDACCIKRDDPGKERRLLKRETAR